MGYMKKKDDNHNEIVQVFREVGARILETYMVADTGCDFIALLNQRVFVVEVKDGSKPPSSRKLTLNEICAREYWAENFHVIESVDDAIKVITRRY